jgi:hypothetical protein
MAASQAGEGRGLAMEYLPRRAGGGRGPLGSRSSRQRVRAGRGDDPLGNPILHVVEAIEPQTLELDDVTQGAPVELHVGEVLEQDVVRLVERALELLAGQARRCTRENSSTSSPTTTPRCSNPIR